jgi:DNA mismatch repair protein MSH4
MERLSELASIYPNVKVCHFQVNVRDNRMDFKFLLKEGHLSVLHYGLLLAGISGLPNSVVEEARSITSKIVEEESRRLELNHMQYLSIRKEYRIAQRLLCLKYGSLTEEDLRASLQNLKESLLDGRL